MNFKGNLVLIDGQARPVTLAPPPSKPRALRVSGACGAQQTPGEGAWAGPAPTVRPAGAPSRGWICRRPSFLPASCVWLPRLGAQWKEGLFQDQGGLTSVLRALGCRLCESFQTARRPFGHRVCSTEDSSYTSNHGAGVFTAECTTWGVLMLCF